jgi:arylsulfatase A-like enzyme
MQGEQAISANVSFADVLPTLCDAAGVDPSVYTSDGHSILPLITGQKESVQDEVFIHYAPRWGKWGEFHSRWIMNGNYKLYRDGRFYNTQNDPLEKVPLKQEELDSGEKNTKSRFQTILDEKEQDIPFALNDKEYKVKH